MDLLYLYGCCLLCYFHLRLLCLGYFPSCRIHNLLLVLSCCLVFLLRRFVHFLCNNIVCHCILGLLYFLFRHMCSMLYCFLFFRILLLFRLDSSLLLLHLLFFGFLFLFRCIYMLLFSFMIVSPIIDLYYNFILKLIL